MVTHCTLGRSEAKAASAELRVSNAFTSSRRRISSWSISLAKSSSGAEGNAPVRSQGDAASGGSRMEPATTRISWPPRESRVAEMSCNVASVTSCALVNFRRARHSGPAKHSELVRTLAQPISAHQRAARSCTGHAHPDTDSPSLGYNVRAVGPFVRDASACLPCVSPVLSPAHPSRPAHRAAQPTGPRAQPLTAAIVAPPSHPHHTPRNPQPQPQPHASKMIEGLKGHRRL